jgi:hypothetical protein
MFVHFVGFLRLGKRNGTGGYLDITKWKFAEKGDDG